LITVAHEAKEWIGHSCPEALNRLNGKPSVLRRLPKSSLLIYPHLRVSTQAASSVVVVEKVTDIHFGPSCRRLATPFRRLFMIDKMSSMLHLIGSNHLTPTSHLPTLLWKRLCPYV
jgi:hypothetical protein